MRLQKGGIRGDTLQLPEHSPSNWPTATRVHAVNVLNPAYLHNFVLVQFTSTLANQYSVLVIHAVSFRHWAR